MSPLAAQQNALVKALFAWPGVAARSAQNELARYAELGTLPGDQHRGLLAYQANGHGLAERALQAAYPVLAQLIGDESFAALSRSLWHAHPPEQGDLAQWGGHLADFIQRSAQLAEDPYLPDVARLEWALHQCASAADVTADSASWALLTTHDPAELTLSLAPGCAVVVSAWPISSIWQAHVQIDLAGASSPAPFDASLGASPHGSFGASLAAVGRKLQAKVAETAVVWREHLQPRVREAMPGEAAFLSALVGPTTDGDMCDLSRALDLATGLDFGGWLPIAVQSGLLLGVVKRG